MDTSDTRTRARGARRRARPNAWHAPFIQAFRNTGNVRAAAQTAGVSRSEVYRARSRNAQFAAAWDDAEEDALDLIEARAFRLALDGNPQLLMFFLRTRRREKYGDQVKVDVRDETRRLAAELGLSQEQTDEVLRELEHVIDRRRRDRRYKW